MNKSDVAYLISETFIMDDYGVQTRTTEKRKVFVNVSSINWQEWFEGGRNGLNPQYRFSMFSYDYQDENIIEYQSKEYTIYRTYRKSIDEIELYAELRKGNELVPDNNG